MAPLVKDLPTKKVLFFVSSAIHLLQDLLMPLFKGSSNSIINQNARELRKSGKPEAEAYAFSIKKAGKDKDKKVSSKVAKAKFKKIKSK